ncbi:copper homeostasis protein CutC [Flagellimonas hymeniacidonis]|uniref:PF03932 family protein CutC n=1 Tax=Flagellimonas hymeniacidonis TaxID=2603628 RepID=A0A5C8V6Z8_9FLAO|nr:copper homeostasis protein CutC [Flagellimonas hymeniacidonis]TXN37093.1 copper homeostasis protein CutC [Flagellimonas hymeniacidonis]
MLIEVCANSLESALNAQLAGADRIELCSELGVGGITPSYGLIKMVKEQLNIPVHVLIRPRSGHFTYSELEFEVMKNDIALCNEAGVDGIVSGLLQSDFTLDFKRTKQLVEISRPMKFTFHRAFDWIPNPEKAQSQLQELEVDCILTSGQQTTAENGLDLLLELNSTSKTCIIMPGGGVETKNIEKFRDAGFKAIHLSGTSFKNQISVAHKISMNSEKHLRENQVAVTNAETIRQIVQSVK